MWTSFWNSTLQSHILSEMDESIISEPLAKSIQSDQEVEIIQVKLRDTLHNRVFRLSARVESVQSLLSEMRERLQVDESWEAPLFYVDEEKEVINMASEADLVEALEMAKRQGGRLVIHYGDVHQEGKKGVDMRIVGVVAGVVITSFILARLFK